MSLTKLPDQPTYLEVLPPRARKVIYAVFILLGAATAAAGAFFVGAQVRPPWWFGGASAALASLMTGGFVVAVTKIPPTPTPAPVTATEVPAAEFRQDPADPTSEVDAAGELDGEDGADLDTIPPPDAD